MIYLVTGAAGFIGSHTVEALLGDGHQVIGVDNLRTGKMENLVRCSRESRFRFEQIDILVDSERLASLVRRVRPDAILHFAALVNVQQCQADPSLAFRLNVEATERMVDLARRHAVKRFVFASSAAVYGDSEVLPIDEGAAPRPLGPYGAGKLASEALLQGYARSYGLAITALRYFNAYGPRQEASSPYSGVISAFHARFKARQQPVIYGDGLQTRDFISVHDIARANVLAVCKAASGWRCLNICTGRETAIEYLAAIFSRAADLQLAPNFEAPRAGEIRRSVGNAGRARDELGFVSAVSIEEGIKELCR